MDISPLAKKLGIKPGMAVAVLGAPDGAVALLAPLPSGATVSVSADRTGADCVLLFVPDAATLAISLPAAIAAGVAGGLLWVAYPKGGVKAGTDLNRDILWARLGDAGLTGVTLVAVDATWSAMRARPADQVKSGPG